MELTTEINNDVCELVVDGELTIYHANLFRQELEKAIKKATAISLDLGKVSEIDTAGFQLLMQARTVCREYDKELNIVAISPAITEVMEIFGLESYFDELNANAGR